MSEFIKFENNVLPTEENNREKESNKIGLKEYSIGEAAEKHHISPGNMETGDLKAVEKIFQNEASRVNNFIKSPNTVPYTFLAREGEKNYGNYTTPEGQDEFKDSDLVLTKDQFCPPEWAKELWDYARIKNKKNFKMDSAMACLRSLEIKNGKPVFTIGAGRYSDSFYSNGLDGMVIGINEEEKKLLSQKLSSTEIGEIEDRAERLISKYGSGRTIRDIIISQNGHLPEFGDHVHNNNLGVAGMVLTRDNEYVFVKRGSSVSVNQGINCTASGAAEFDEATLSQYGLQHFIGNEMSQEANKELGLKAGALIIGSMKKRIDLELGLKDSEYDIIPVGFIRELPRGGKPECMFLIQYKGSTEELVKCVSENMHSEKNEIDGSVYSLAKERVDELLKKKEFSSYIQHKGMVNLMLCNEYLNNSKN